MMDAFAVALHLVLEHEGGYVNDPQDPGGETIFGISRRAHPEAWANGRPSQQAAAAIYRRDYWQAARCPDLPAPVAIFLFDMAVNMGVRGGTKLLQRALGLTEDGVIGPITLRAVMRMDPDELVAHMAAERLLYYSNLSTWQRFGRGWSRRTMHTAMAAVAVEGRA